MGVDFVYVPVYLAPCPKDIGRDIQKNTMLNSAVMFLFFIVCVFVLNNNKYNTVANTVLFKILLYTLGVYYSNKRKKKFIFEIEFICLRKSIMNLYIY